MWVYEHLRAILAASSRASYESPCGFMRADVFTEAAEYFRLRIPMWVYEVNPIESSVSGSFVTNPHVGL